MHEPYNEGRRGQGRLTLVIGVTREGWTDEVVLVDIGKKTPKRGFMKIKEICVCILLIRCVCVWSVLRERWWWWGVTSRIASVDDIYLFSRTIRW